MKTKILYRPIGPEELRLIEESGYKKFPTRLPEQPLFYPVLNEEYAVEITKKWNVPQYGAGYVTRFQINEDYIKKFKTETVGNKTHKELWVPAEELEEFNKNIVGKIKVIHIFRKK